MNSIIINYSPDIEENLFWLLDHFTEDELVYVENNQHKKDDVLSKLSQAIKEIKAIKDETTELDKEMEDLLVSIERDKN